MAAAIDEEPDGAPLWITTFVDMISLLVTFFILLFTFSSLEQYDVFTFPQNIIGTRGIVDSSGSTDVTPPANDVMSAMNVSQGADIPHARPPEKLSEALENMGQKPDAGQKEVDPKSVPDGMLLRFGSQASFSPGGTQPNAALRRSLEELAEVMRHYDHTLVVEGFADSEFKATPSLPSAEALSCARAVAAADVLVAAGIDPSRVQVAGLGQNRPVTSGESPSQRTQNRRVEVRVLTSTARPTGSAAGGR